MILKDVITWASVGVQGLAALLWFASTVVRVNATRVEEAYKKIHGPDSGPFQIVSENGSDFIQTVKLQALWNRWAALATGVGIGLLAIATALPNSD